MEAYASGWACFLQLIGIDEQKLSYSPWPVIYATQLKVNALRFDKLAPGPAALLSAYGPQLAEQSLQDVVLHQLKPADLALPDGMGLQPDKITVTAQGISISFVPKPMSQPLQPAQAS